METVPSCHEGGGHLRSGVGDCAHGHPCWGPGEGLGKETRRFANSTETLRLVKRRYERRLAGRSCTSLGKWKVKYNARKYKLRLGRESSTHAKSRAPRSPSVSRINFWALCRIILQKLSLVAIKTSEVLWCCMELRFTYALTVVPVLVFPYQ